MKLTVISIVIGALGIDTGTGGFGNKMTSGDHPNYSIIKIGQNNGKTWLEKTFCHSDTSENSPANVDVENLSHMK